MSHETDAQSECTKSRVSCSDNPNDDAEVNLLTSAIVVTNALWTMELCHYDSQISYPSSHHISTITLPLLFCTHHTSREHLPQSSKQQQWRDQGCGEYNLGHLRQEQLVKLTATTTQKRVRLLYPKLLFKVVIGNHPRFAYLQASPLEWRKSKTKP